MAPKLPSARRLRSGASLRGRGPVGHLAGAGRRRRPAPGVPGHWRSNPAFAEDDGPLLYRRRFEFPPPDPGRRVWLTLDGLFYLGDVWLDGAYIGDTEGYFFPHTFDVTQTMLERGEHLLAVEVTCSPSKDRTAKRNIIGVFEHWDC